MTAETDHATLRVLLDQHARFLGFLARRTGSREVAEDVLHDAYLRSLERGSRPRDSEAVTGWFYRVLRNALSDHYRRRGAEQRALERAAAQPETPPAALDEELMQAVCACVGELIDTLKPEYASALRQVDLAGDDVAAFAARSGISANNASVRLHRARRALRTRVERTCGACAAHGCLDCGCRAKARSHAHDSTHGC
jgi:RNA polymerase sigma-70 factor (ECF subfamily)